MRYYNYRITIGGKPYVLVSDDGGAFGPIFEEGSDCRDFPSPFFLETGGRIYEDGELVAVVPALANGVMRAEVGAALPDNAVVGLGEINALDASSNNPTKDAVGAMTLRERRELRYPSDERFVGLLS